MDLLTYISISFGGIPNSRNVLILQICLKRAAKPSAGNTSAGFPWIKWPQILLNLTWLCTKASRNLLRNLLRNPVEPDLALHQSLPEPPEPSPEPCWTWPGSAPKPPTPSPEPSPEPCWTWPGSAPKPPTLSPEPSPEPCWTWPGSAPKPPRPSPEPSPEPCWTWLGFAPRFPGTSSGAFSGTFSGTLLNVTWLCTKVSQTFSGTFGTLRNIVEPDPAPAPAHTGAEDPISLRCCGKMVSFHGCVK